MLFSTDNRAKMQNESLAKQRPKNMRNALAHSNGKCERKVSPAMLFGWWTISRKWLTLLLSSKPSIYFWRKNDTSRLMRNFGIFIAIRNIERIRNVCRDTLRKLTPNLKPQWETKLQMQNEMKIKVDQQQKNYEMTWNRQLFMHCQIWTLAKWPTCPNHSKCKKAKSWNLGMKSSIALSLAKPITDLSETFSSTSINDKGSSSNCELCFTIVPKTFSRKFFMHRKAFDKLDTLSALAFLSPLAQHKVDAADSPKIDDSSLTQNENESFAVHTRKGQKQVCPQGWLAAQKCSGTKNSKPFKRP